MMRDVGTGYGHSSQCADGKSQAEMSWDLGEYECTYPHTTIIDPPGELTMVSVSSACVLVCLCGDSEIEGTVGWRVEGCRGTRCDDLNCVKERRGKQL
jgi:hypothetical protein